MNTKSNNLQQTAEIKTFETGAKRSTDADSVRYDAIPTGGLERLAKTCAEGIEKYGKDNWKKGLPADDVVNHVIRHIYLWIEGDRTEDHLAHAAWGLFVVMHFEKYNPEMVSMYNKTQNSRVENKCGSPNCCRTLKPSYQYKLQE